MGGSESERIPDSKDLRKAYRDFIKAFIKYDGHMNSEFQEAKNRKASDRVLDRNIAKVKSTAMIYDEEIQAEIKVLEKKLDYLKATRSYLRDIEMSRQPTYCYGVKEFFPEIEKGADAYFNRYLDRKYKPKDED